MGTTKRGKRKSRGTIRQIASGRWQVVITLPPEQGDDGKRVYPQSVKTFDTQRDAEQWRLEQTDPRRRPRTERRMTVEALLDKWLDHQHDRIAATTHATYKRYVTNRVNPHIGDIVLDELSVDDIDDLYRLLKRDMQPASIRQVHAILRGALAWGRKRGYVDMNVAVDAEPPTVRRKKREAPTPVEIQKLLAAAMRVDPWFGVACRLAAATGARRGTIAGFRLSDFRFGTGEVLIDRSIAVVDGTLHVKGLKADNGGWIPVGQQTMDMVIAHVVRLYDRARVCGVALGDDFYLFAQDIACTIPVAPYMLTNRWVKMAARAGLGGVRFHDLRHYVATELLAAGYDPVTIAERLRWESPAMLYEVYGHSRPERATDASAHIERSLG